MTIAASTKLAELTALAAATPKYFQNVPMLIATETYSNAEVMAVVNVVLASAQSVATTKGAAHDALVADQIVQKKYAQFIKELKQVIGVAFSTSATTLSEFGMKPRKPRTPLTNEERAVADAKGRATRAARGTKGKRQKAAIKGTVTGVTIAPILAPGASAPEAPTAAAPHAVDGGAAPK